MCQHSGPGVFRDGMEIDDVLREADEEMYRSKRASKSSVTS
ncbi:MAG: hypothetical protein SCM96_13295 [Acidobacteriota bacterium]|nr:hypothetical protein [Acidobacteriota bacterium]